MGLLDILCNTVAGAGAANHDQEVHGGDSLRAASNLFAASQHRECLDDGRTGQASWWGGYAGQAADNTRRGWW
jgi:hypothetical protein